MINITIELTLEDADTVTLVGEIVKMLRGEVSEEETPKEEGREYNTSETLNFSASMRYTSTDVTNILSREEEVEEDEYFMYVRPAVVDALHEGHARDMICRAAEQVVKERHELGYYEDIPLAAAFKQRVDRELISE